jgi:hypothetical protein
VVPQNHPYLFKKPVTSHDTSHLGIVDSDKSGLTLTVRADEDEDYSDGQND